MPNTPGVKLQPDDLARGQFVTVLAGPHRMTEYTVGDYDSTRYVVDQSLEGIPMQVLAIDLPYVVLAYLNSPNRRIVDVRDTELKRLSSDYVAALVPQALKQPESPAPIAECNCASCVAMRSALDDMRQCGGK